MRVVTRTSLAGFFASFAAAMLLMACGTSTAGPPSSARVVLFLAPSDPVDADAFSALDVEIVRSEAELKSAVTDETQAIVVTSASLSLVEAAYLQAAHDRGVILGGIETGMRALQPFSVAANQEPRPDRVQGFGDMVQMAVAYSITCPVERHYSGLQMQPAQDLTGLLTGMEERFMDRCDRL